MSLRHCAVQGNAEDNEKLFLKFQAELLTFGWGGLFIQIIFPWCHFTPELTKVNILNLNREPKA